MFPVHIKNLHVRSGKNKAFFLKGKWWRNWRVWYVGLAVDFLGCYPSSNSLEYFYISLYACTTPWWILYTKYNCAVYSRSKKRNTPIYFSTNHRTEMKLIPIIMDYYLLLFDALKFFLGIRLCRGLCLTFIFSL